MQSTPKGLRLQIALVGRTNVGKSSFLNFVTNQDVAIVSPIPGTTTDIVEKPIELLPFGPVNFLDTGGVDDQSILAEKRIQRTQKIFERADVVVLIVETNIWTEFEKNIAETAKKQNLPLIVVVNKIDLATPKDDFITKIKEYTENILLVSTIDKSSYNKILEEFKKLLFKVSENINDKEISLLGDLLPKNALVVFIVPIDSEAPKGRLILPQVQAIRDVLDNDCAVLVVKDTEYKHYLEALGRKPDLVVCDSQVVHKMVAETPVDVKCTTFSILFCRFKGDLMTEVIGSAYADFLEEGDNVLIAEACSHHPLQDDIGRVKIPRWLQEYLGKRLNFEVSVGRDFPADLKKYKLIIHCGSCMLTRREKLVRIAKAREQGIPITNYGIMLSKCKGVLERVLSPFPEIQKAYKEILTSKQKVLSL
ncbi:MAG: [FeFe]-hydrogenase maturation protein HydF [Candidatus Kapaibacterium sp.]|nr:MAG: [FeFe]-hydrogenase maturation protein HydF [Candidatus Kapabacteria bacterium]